MCRRNQLLGCMLLSFGLGMVLATVIGTAFWCCCLAFAAGALGFVVIRVV